MSEHERFRIEWVDCGREPQCPPNPDYPHGKDVDLTLGAGESCVVRLPYPARRCGFYIITCKTCGNRLACTTAGRPDDPRSARIPCNKPGGYHCTINP